MNSPDQKRVVSKAEYRRYLAKRCGMRAVAGVLGLGIVYMLYRMMKTVLEFVFYKDDKFSVEFVLFMASLVVLSNLLVIVLLYLSRAVLHQQIRRLEPVEPVSRHNIDRFAPADVLVRSSDAPRAPEAVLLRAVQERADTLQEQLLRPSE